MRMAYIRKPDGEKRGSKKSETPLLPKPIYLETKCTSEQPIEDQPAVERHKSSRKGKHLANR